MISSLPGSRRAIVASAALLVLVVGIFSFANASAQANPTAAFTTVNAQVDGPGTCNNGNPDVNCNIYTGGQFVWLNGGPVNAALGDGRYFFAVVSPGGQSDPNDGSPKLLSTDAFTNRTFSVANGVLTYNGTHSFDSNMIRLAPFMNTPNPGGEYLLAICSLANGVPVAPRTCKYDAFKVMGENGNPTSSSSSTTSSSSSTTSSSSSTTSSSSSTTSSSTSTTSSSTSTTPSSSSSTTSTTFEA